MGGAVLTFGTMIAAWPSRESIQSIRHGGMLARIAIVGGIMLGSATPMIIQSLQNDEHWGSALRWKLASPAGTPVALEAPSPPLGDS